jgi:hypothetical protein
VIKVVAGINRMMSVVQQNLVGEGEAVDISLKIGREESDKVSSNLDPLLKIDED